MAELLRKYAGWTQCAVLHKDRHTCFSSTKNDKMNTGLSREMDKSQLKIMPALQREMAMKADTHLAPICIYKVLIIVVLTTKICISASRFWAKYGMKMSVVVY